MSTENEAIARRFFEELCNGRRHELADEIIAPDWTMHEPQTPSAGTGPQAGVETARVYQEGLEGRWDIVSSGNKVVTRWIGHGVHNSELMGIPPTGREIHVDAITIQRIEDGKIAEDWTVWDALGMLQQLGVVEAPAAA